MRDAGDVASSLVASFVAWARVDWDQFWLEPTHSPPRVMWTSSLRDQHGDRLAIGYPTHLAMHGISMEQPVLDSAGLLRIAESARAVTAPSTAETLLADARFYAWQASEPNPRLGLLLAAIACEVRVKAYLTGVASAKQVSLVDLILDSPRDVSVAASSLFDKGLKAVTGVSMKERDPGLWKAVDLLFGHRNRVAHRGDTALSGSEITTDIQAAARAFLFLRDLETPPPKGDHS